MSAALRQTWALDLRTICSAFAPWHFNHGIALPQLLVYGAFSYMTFVAAVNEPWFTDTSYFWRGYPKHSLS